MKIIVTKKGEKLIVDDDIYEKIEDLKWHINKMFDNGKRVARRNKIPNSDCTYLHHYVLGRKPTINEGVFFKNENSLDYRRSNLEFRINTRKKKGKYIGVLPVKMFLVRVHHNGKRVRVGVFSNELQAVKARNEYCKKHKLSLKMDNI